MVFLGLSLGVEDVRDVDEVFALNHHCSLDLKVMMLHANQKSITVITFRERR